MALFRGHAGRNQARRGRMVKASGDQVQGLIDTPQTLESHGFDRLTHGEVLHVGVLLRRVVHDAIAKFVTHARDKAKLIHDLTTVGLFQVISAPEEILPTPIITPLPSRVCGMSVLEEKLQKAFVYAASYYVHVSAPSDRRFIPSTRRGVRSVEPRLAAMVPPRGTHSTAERFRWI